LGFSISVSARCAGALLLVVYMQGVGHGILNIGRSVAASRVRARGASEVAGLCRHANSKQSFEQGSLMITDGTRTWQTIIGLSGGRQAKLVRSVYGDKMSRVGASRFVRIAELQGTTRCHVKLMEIATGGRSDQTSGRRCGLVGNEQMLSMAFGCGMQGN
jgi:hypothetical protein